MQRPLAHGGDLGAARLLFPGAPEPFVDLSTGINPHAYPIPRLEPEAVPAAAGAGSDALGSPAWPRKPMARRQPRTWLPRRARRSCCRSRRPGAARARRGAGTDLCGACARRAAGRAHAVTEVADVDQLEGADLAIVVNPNNPDGRIVGKDALLAVAEDLQPRGGLLDGRRSLRGCRSRRREPRRRGRARQHRGAAIVRQVLRAGRPAARLRARRAGARRAPRRVARTLGGGGTGDRDRRDRLGGYRMGGGDARAAGSATRSARRAIEPRRGSTSSAGRHCSGWCERRRRATCSITWVAPASWCADSPSSRPGCGLGFRPARRHGIACGRRLLHFRTDNGADSPWPYRRRRPLALGPVWELGYRHRATTPWASARSVHDARDIQDDQDDLSPRLL